MSILEKIKQPEFWKNVAKVGFPFFIVLIIISLIMSSARDLFSGDFAAVNETNFSDGKWQRFFGIKIAISFLYALFTTNKNTK